MADYSGGAGPDSVFGGGADESFDYSQGGDDTVFGGGGADTIYMGAAYTSGDVINGEAGSDTLQLEGDYAGVLELDASSITGVEAIELMGFHSYHVMLGDGMLGSGDSLTVTVADVVDAQIIDGSGLEFTSLSVELGGTVGQRVLGGMGDDHVKLDNGIDRTDVFDLGDGDDTLELNNVYMNAAAHSFRNIEHLVIDGACHLRLVDFNVSAGDALTISTTVDSTVVAKQVLDGMLHMTGGAGRDGFYGGHSGDTLEGGVGQDTLWGGRGADILSGGADADTFIYSSIQDSVRGRADLITDLDDSDTINLTAVDADTTQRDRQRFTLVDHFSHHAGELTFGYNASSGYTRIAGDTDGDGRADFVIQITGDHSDFPGLVL